MIEGLNPCPECWGEGSLRMDWNSGKSYVCCDDCRAHTQLYDEEECAIADWNSGQVISRREVKQANSEQEAKIEQERPHEELKLRLCPYCGSEGRVVFYNPGYYAACENEECYAHTAVCGSAIGAADDWNGGGIFTTWYRRAE